MRRPGSRNPLARVRRPPPAEFALAVVVTAVMCADLGQASSVGLGLALVVPAGLTLAWRLSAPLVPLLLTCIANLVLLAGAPGEFGPQTVVIGVLVAVYSAAAYLTGRSALAAGALSLGLVTAAHISTPDGHPDDFLPLVVWGLPWLAGRLVRRQTLRAREAGARAALAEMQADEAASQERDRIARELHDVIAHSVSLMVVQAGAERMSLHRAESPRTHAALEAIETAGRQALGELRAMLGVLRSTSNDERTPQPDLSALPALVEQVRAAGLPVQLQMANADGVPPGVALAAYRVVQESLTNALRHAGAVPTVVDVSCDNALHVRVENPLNGSARDPVGSGRGLIGMRERVELHGGILSVGPADGCWRVAATLPLGGSERQ